MGFARYATALRLACRIGFANAWPPRRRSLQQRLAMFPVHDAPVSQPVEILWNDHQIPFIEAQRDDDLAAALGIVHAHLRLGQMELMRRMAQGRVSEIVGGLGLPIDRLIRTFDIGRVVPQIVAGLPDETRSWLENFARGNQSLSRAGAGTPLRICSSELAAGTLERGRSGDAGTSGVRRCELDRVDAASEISRRSGLAVLLAALLRHDLLSFESADKAEHARLSPESLAALALRSGSNSLCVAAARSESGGALMANDPHLPITMPNVWLLAGVKSPSHHAVGLMVPGIPFIGMGRNPWIAWGGTSLHAASSDLVAVPECAPLRERRETIASGAKATSL